MDLVTILQIVGPVLTVWGMLQKHASDSRKWQGTTDTRLAVIETTLKIRSIQE